MTYSYLIMIIPNHDYDPSDIWTIDIGIQLEGCMIVQCSVISNYLDI